MRRNPKLTNINMYLKSNNNNNGYYQHMPDCEVVPQHAIGNKMTVLVTTATNNQT